MAQEATMNYSSPTERANLEFLCTFWQAGTCEAEQIQAPSPPSTGEEGKAELPGSALEWSKAEWSEVKEGGDKACCGITHWSALWNPK